MAKKQVQQQHGVRDVLAQYHFTGGVASEQEILDAAADILQRKLERCGRIGDPLQAARFLQMKLAGESRERFGVLWLDTRHQILGFEILFSGTIDGAEVAPREVVRAALRANAAACILTHNHPSGVVDPSASDRMITTRLREALALIDVRVLDHIIVGAGSTCSMAARGLL